MRFTSMKCASRSSWALPWLVHQLLVERFDVGDRSAVLVIPILIEGSLDESVVEAADDVVPIVTLGKDVVD